MTEEPKQDAPIPTPSYLEQVRAEREAMQKITEDNKKILEQMQQIKAEQILSGETDAGHKQEVKREETPAEYIKRLMEGKI